MRFSDRLDSPWAGVVLAIVIVAIVIISETVIDMIQT